MPNIAALKMQNPLAIPALLAFSTPKSPTRFHEDPFLRPLVEGIAKLGYVEGQNVVIEHRFPAEQPQSHGRRAGTDDSGLA
jgi:hypothetical protein